MVLSCKKRLKEGCFFECTTGTRPRAPFLAFEPGCLTHLNNSFCGYSDAAGAWHLALVEMLKSLQWLQFQTVAFAWHRVVASVVRCGCMWIRSWPSMRFIA